MAVAVQFENIMEFIPEFTALAGHFTSVEPVRIPDVGTVDYYCVSQSLGVYKISVFLDLTACADTGDGDDSSAIGTALPPNADLPFPPVWPYKWDTSLLYGRENLGQNLKMIHGDTFKFDIVVTQNGELFNLSGCSLKLTAKWAQTDADASKVFSCDSATPDGITITDSAAGEVSITIAASKTNSLPYKEIQLYYDIQVTNASSEIYTVLLGKLLIRPDTTRA